MGPVTPEDPLTLEDSARRIGGYLWLEMRLFEVLGSWVPHVPERDVKLRIAAHAHHHGWHAELWHTRLPRFGDHTEESLVAPAHEGWQTLMTAVSEPEGPSTTIEKLVGVYRVLLPRKIATYRAHLARTDPVTDASVSRTLRLALNDELEHWAEGLAMLDALVLDDGHVARVLEHQAPIERTALRLD